MITAPIINLNGTSKDELLRLHLDAMRALGDAITALSFARPHGRDFQTASANAFVQATSDHLARIKSLWSIHNEIEAIVDAIAEQREMR